MMETPTAVDSAAVPKENDPADAGVDTELVGQLHARATGLQLTGDGVCCSS